MRELERNQGEL